MRLRVVLTMASLFFCTGIAVASPLPTAGDSISMSLSSTAMFTGDSAGLRSAKGLLAGAGLTGAIAAISRIFDNHSSGEAVTVPGHAPEISTSGIFSGIVLLLGGGLIVRGRQQSQTS